MNDNLIFALLLIILVCSSCVLFYMLYNSKRAASVSDTQIRSHQKQNEIYRLGRIYQKVPLIRMEYNRIREKIALLMPGDIVTINHETTVVVTKSLLKGLLLLLASLLLAGGDLYFSLAGVMVSYLIFTQSYRGMIERKEIRILTQFADFLEDIRHYYHDMHLIDDAIYATMEHVEKDLAPHILRLYEILKSPNISLEVEKYAQSSPNRFFTTLASICVSITDYGDKKTEQGGSLFLRNLNYLREEVLMELNRKEQINYRFHSLVQISLFPLIFIKPIEFWAKNIMEGMANIYNGLYGLIAMLAIFFITFFCYTLVCIYKDDDKGQLIEDSIWHRVSSKQPISGLLNREINRHYTKYLSIDTSLKQIGDQTGPKSFLFKRIVYGCVGAATIFIVTVSIPFYQKDNLRHNFSEAFQSMNVADEETTKTMEEIAQEVLPLCEHRNLSVEEIADIVLQNTDLHQEVYVNMVATVVYDRVISLKNTFYRFYYLIFIATGFLLGYMVPMWMLNYRVKANEMSKEDEVNQFQTLILIYMHTDGITLEDILEWMERFAFTFRSTITECVMGLAFGEQKALQAMREREQFAPFKRFIDNLIAIDSVGIEAAFDEIQTERDYYKDKRRLDNQKILSKKATRARRAAFLPLFSVIGLYLLAPIIIAAVQLLLSLVAATSI